MANMVTMLSGGAEGADTEWGEIASLHGHEVIHFSFDNHKTVCPNGQIIRLPYNHLLIADPWLKQAKSHLHRLYPAKSKYVNNLLRRNYYQVKETDAVYAIGTFQSHNYLVDGGTAWATTMYCLIHNKPFYFFHQDRNKWFEMDINGSPIEIRMPPRPEEGVWTGIGTRNINLNGRMAIDYLFNG